MHLAKTPLIYILLACALVIVYNGKIASSEHIVFLLSCSSYSHRVAIWPIVDALSRRGHNVTFIGNTPGPSETKINSTITEIVPKKLQIFMNKVIDNTFDVSHKASAVMPKVYMIMGYFCFSACNELLTSEEIQNWLSTSPKVDLIISDVTIECGSGLAYKLGAKHALFMPIPFISKYFDAFGMPPESSSIPDSDVSYPAPLSFWNRLAGLLLPLYWRASDLFFYQWYRTIFKEQLGIKNVPSLYQVQDNISLAFCNGDYIDEYARSVAPFVINVPGLHVEEQPAKSQLDIEISNFIQSKNDTKPNEGFIYISLGTIAKAHNLPKKIKETFFKSIEALPNIKFIWRWEGSRPDEYPKNLLLLPWVNQQALLGHPKIRGFVTQAGRPSTQESIYHGVPMITFPILADQDYNAHRFEGLGCSINLDILTVDKTQLTRAIQNILIEKSYKDRAVQISKLVKDKPMKSVDTAVWWTEFVLRHSQEEINLLKPPARNLTWYQKRDLDTWGFILICIVLTGFVNFYIIQFILVKVGSLWNNNSPTAINKNGKLKKLN